MARREREDNRGFQRAVEDVRRKMEAERKDVEAKLRTAAKLMVLKERASWRDERQQLLADNDSMQQRLSTTKEDNRKLRADLHVAETEMKRKEKEMGSLNHQLCVLTKRHDDLVAARRELKKEVREIKKESKKAEEVVKERDEEIVSLQQRLSITEEDNRKLKADLHTAEQEIKSKEMGSLEHQLKVLEKRHDDSVAARRELEKELRELKKESKKAEDIMKKKDEEIVSLQQSLHVQKEEAEQLRASFDHRKESSGLRTEAEWQSEVHQLQDLLTEKEQELRRLRAKRRARTRAHLENLVQLTLSQQRADCLQEQLQELAKRDDSQKKELSEEAESMEKELAEKMESFRKELSQREESFRMELTEREESFEKELSANQTNIRMQLSQKETVEKELSDSLQTARQELTTICEMWEKRAQQWSKNKKELSQKVESLEIKMAEKLESYTKELAEKEESFKKELLEKETLQKELSDRLLSARQELSTLCKRWETRAQQWSKDKKELSQKVESLEIKMAEKLESYTKELAEKEESFKKELLEKETLQKELSDRLLSATQELSALCKRWETRAQQWSKEKKELEQMLLVKEKIWQHKEEEMKEDVHLLTQKNIELQKLAVENKEKKSFWRW